MKITALILILCTALLVGCRTAEPEFPPPTVTQVPVLVTVIVTATPEPTPEPVPTIEPTPLATATPAPTVEVLPTPEPVIVTVLVPVVETVIVNEAIPVTVVVTATAIPTTTATVTPTPTPTVTPVPTATPIPPFIQSSIGKGSKLTTTFSFWDEKIIVVTVDAQGTGAFKLDAITPAGCVVSLTAGTAPYGAVSVAEPTSPDACDGTHQIPNGSRLAIIAGPDVTWSVDLTQYSQSNKEVPPVSIEGSGQSIAGPYLLGQSERLSFGSIGQGPITLDVYSLFDNEPVIKNIVSENGPIGGTWFIGVPLGTYMIAVDTMPGREWSAEIYR